MKQYPDIRIAISKNYACLRYFSIENPWIDFAVIVPTKYAESTKSIITKALSDLWDNSHQDECYGDILERYLGDKDIPYIILYHSDKEEDEEYEEWWNKLVQNM